MKDGVLQGVVDEVKEEMEWSQDLDMGEVDDVEYGVTELFAGGHKGITKLAIWPHLSCPWSQQ